MYEVASKLYICWAQCFTNHTYKMLFIGRMHVYTIFLLNELRLLLSCALDIPRSQRVWRTCDSFKNGEIYHPSLVPFKQRDQTSFLVSQLQPSSAFRQKSCLPLFQYTTTKRNNLLQRPLNHHSLRRPPQLHIGVWTYEKNAQRQMHLQTHEKQQKC